MNHSPSYTPERTNWLGRNASRLAIAYTLLNMSACDRHDQRAVDQKNSYHEVSTGASLGDQRAIEAANQALVANPTWMPSKVVDSYVFRLGDEGWGPAYARATLNSTGEFPNASLATPESTTVVYLVTDQDNGIVVALNERTGAFISMDGDN